jgi:hypothetical protein
VILVSFPYIYNKCALFLKVPLLFDLPSYVDKDFTLTNEINTPSVIYILTLRIRMEVTVLMVYTYFKSVLWDIACHIGFSVHSLQTSIDY